MTKTERIAQMLEQNEGMEVTVRKVMKNGVELEAIMIGSGDVRPTVYPDRMSGTDEEIVDEIVNIAICGTPSFEIEKITEWEKAKDLVTLAIRPATNDSVATMPYLDLEVYAEVHVNDDAVTKVTDAILSMYEICAKELMEAAIKNTKYVIQPLAEKMIELCPEMIGEETEETLEEIIDRYPPMIIATTESGVHGASFMYSPSNFKPIADGVDDDLYILPSSIHEVLIVPAYGHEPDALRMMVKEVNNTQVLPEEILSYNVYKYTRKTNKLTIA